jgi:hypothetical protein
MLSIPLFTGLDSPVKIAWSVLNVTVCSSNILKSAGILSPYLISTISPGTKLFDSIWAQVPFLKHKASGL